MKTMKTMKTIKLELTEKEYNILACTFLCGLIEFGENTECEKGILNYCEINPQKVYEVEKTLEVLCEKNDDFERDLKPLLDKILFADEGVKDETN